MDKATEEAIKKSMARLKESGVLERLSKMPVKEDPTCEICGSSTNCNCDYDMEIHENEKEDEPYP
jgi:hypothetical protein